MKEFKVGLIGFGLGGQVFHAPLIDYVVGLHLVKIRTTNPEHINLAKSRYPNVEIVADNRAIIDDVNIDLVVIATPHKFHFSLAEALLRSGKHVVVEKPFTVSSAEADHLIALAKEKDRVLSVYQNRRWDADFLTLKKVLSSGKLGRIVEFESHFDRFRNSIRPNTWKESGDEGNGLLYDLGAHLIDQALVLFGLPKAVTAFISIQRSNSQIVDNFEVLMHYEGLKVTIKSGMLVKAKLPKYIVLGAHGAFVKFGLDIQEDVLKAYNKSLSDTDWGEEPSEQYGQIDFIDNSGQEHQEIIKSEAGNYAAYYQNIYNVLIGTDELVVTAEQGRNTIKIIEMARQSAKENRTILIN